MNGIKYINNINDLVSGNHSSNYTSCDIDVFIKNLLLLLSNSIGDGGCSNKAQELDLEHKTHMGVSMHQPMLSLGKIP